MNNEKMKKFESARIGTIYSQPKKQKKVENEESVIRRNNLILEIIMLERERNKSQQQMQLKGFIESDEKKGVFPPKIK